jgi:uncharacterized protein
MNYITSKKGKLLISIHSDRCDLCGCCVGVCPEDALELSEKELRIIPLSCTNCCKCIWSCPLEAIEFKREGVLA